MSSETNTIEIPLTLGKARLDLRLGRLAFINSAGRVIYDFRLNPHIEYRGKEAQQSPARFERREGEDHFVFQAGDGVLEKEIHVQVRGGFLDYWVLAEPIHENVEIETVHYGQAGATMAEASEQQLEEFFILCPDRYGSLIPKADEINFKLGVWSFRFEEGANFPHEGGRTIVPPYVAALRGGEDWLGVGTMEIPTSQYGLNMTFRQGRAVIDFFYGGNLKLSGPFALPRITFFTRPEKVATVKAYIDRLYADGLAQPHTGWDPAWTGPIYCFFSDQMYEYQTDRDTDEMLGEMTMTENYCNEAFMRQSLSFLAEHDIPVKVLIIDYGWFVCNGQWKPNTARFKDLKATIRRLQEQGTKVLVWHSPYFIAEQADHYQNHPEIAVRTRQGKPFFITRFKIEKNFQCDFTHPTMRRCVEEDLEFMLGPDGLNADGIKVDCTHQPPTLDNVFHDPSWGTGEMFHYKASKFIYETAKRIKPSCCINTTAGNPLFNNTFDLHRIHDGLEYNLDAYEERAWAAWLCGVPVSDLDDWPSCDLFTVRGNLRKIVYGAPSLYAARKRGCGRKMKCPYGYSQSTPDEQLQLLATLYELCASLPIEADQKLLIDPFGKVFERRYGSGPLAGFYAAKTLSGHQAVAVYTDTHARVVSITEAALAVPLPPGAANVALSLVDRSGKNVSAGEFKILDGEMLFQARRCTGQAAYYRISYTL